MTDRPSSGTTADAAPAPGYYPDPSIPGFVRYWDGAAWAPGTTRPAPGPGEVLAPPRLVARRQAPPMRPVPPPATPGEGESAAGPGPGGALPVRRSWAGPAALEESGPVFFDETTGGTSFTTEPRPAPAGPPLASPAPWSAPPLPAAPVRPAVPRPEGAQTGPAERAAWTALSPAVPAAALPAEAEEAAAPGVHAGAAVPDPVPAAPLPVRQPEAGGPAEPARPTATPTGPDPTEPDRLMHRTGDDDRDGRSSGWQADVHSQRGLMESQASPRWVSWGADGPEAAPAAEAVAEATPFAAPAPAPAASSVPASPAPSGAPAEQSTETCLPPVPSPSARRPLPGTAHRTPLPTSYPVPPAPAPAPGAGPDEAKPAAKTPASRAAERRRARPAGYGRRLAARVIDTLAVAALAGAAAVPLGASAVHHLQTKIDAARASGRAGRVWLVDPVVLGRAGLFLLALLLIGFVYEALPTARWGRTLGKRIARVRVLDAESQQPPGLGGSVRRWLARQLLGALLLGGALDVLWCLFDRPLRQCWHDKAAGTFLAVDQPRP
ncbi:RDD family protein [Peterkaempfera sp. SMS 1(5)a]|uniref:RDD family protein n=1 Tax=Peterkaempfera podocarpi TaxID=3232308 RepID=UPI0036709437